MASQLYVIQGASAFWKRQTPVMRGIVLMCLSTGAFSIMHGLVRFVSEVLPPFQIAFFRNIFGLVFLFPLLKRSRFAILRTKRIGLHALRGVINMAAMLMFFTDCKGHGSQFHRAYLHGHSRRSSAGRALSNLSVGDDLIGVRGHADYTAAGPRGHRHGCIIGHYVGRTLGRGDDHYQDPIAYGVEPNDCSLYGYFPWSFLDRSGALGLAAIRASDTGLDGVDWSLRLNCATGN